MTRQFNPYLAHPKQNDVFVLQKRYFEAQRKLQQIVVEVNRTQEELVNLDEKLTKTIKLGNALQNRFSLDNVAPKKYPPLKSFKAMQEVIERSSVQLVFPMNLDVAEIVQQRQLKKIKITAEFIEREEKFLTDLKNEVIRKNKLLGFELYRARVFSLPYIFPQQNRLRIKVSSELAMLPNQELKARYDLEKRTKSSFFAMQHKHYYLFLTGKLFIERAGLAAAHLKSMQDVMVNEALSMKYSFMITMLMTQENLHRASLVFEEKSDHFDIAKISLLSLEETQRNALSYARDVELDKRSIFMKAQENYFNESVADFVEKEIFFRERIEVEQKNNLSVFRKTHFSFLAEARASFFSEKKQKLFSDELKRSDLIRREELDAVENIFQMFQVANHQLQKPVLFLPSDPAALRKLFSPSCKKLFDGILMDSDFLPAVRLWKSIFNHSTFAGDLVSIEHLLSFYQKIMDKNVEINATDVILFFQLLAIVNNVPEDCCPLATGFANAAKSLKKHEYKKTAESYAKKFRENLPKLGEIFPNPVFSSNSDANQRRVSKLAFQLSDLNGDIADLYFISICIQDFYQLENAETLKIMLSDVMKSLENYFSILYELYSARQSLGLFCFEKTDENVAAIISEIVNKFKLVLPLIRELGNNNCDDGLNWCLQLTTKMVSLARFLKTSWSVDSSKPVMRL